MSELGLFPLPLVLLPTELLPLHVFEPRYRELIGECLETGGEFGIVFSEREESVHPVGTRAAVVDVLERLPDGRLNVVVEGRERFVVVERTGGRSFATALVEPMEDDADAFAPADVERALAAFSELAAAAETELEAPDSSAADLDFRLAARIAFEPASKQQLVELTSPRRRLALLVELLDEALSSYRAQKLVHERASGNGRVHPVDSSG